LLLYRYLRVLEYGSRSIPGFRWISFDAIVEPVQGAVNALLSLFFHGTIRTISKDDVNADDRVGGTDVLLMHGSLPLSPRHYLTRMFG